MLQHVARSLDRYATTNPFTWVYGLGRSLLAAGTLITLLFSGPEVLFDKDLFGKLSLNPAFESFNIFFQFGFNHLYYAYALCIGILLLVMSGVFPRYTGVLHWLVTYSFFQAGSILEGGDQIASILTLLLIPVTLLDNRRNHWHTEQQVQPRYYANFIARGALTLIALQMAVLYLHAGVEKLYKLDEWKNGTAVYYFFNDPLFGYPDWMDAILRPALTNSLVVTSLTWGTMLFEVLLFGALFMAPGRRRHLLGAAIGFHFGIALIFGLVSFFLAMAGGLVLYLLPAQARQPQSWARFRPRLTSPVGAPAPALTYAAQSAQAA